MVLKHSEKQRLTAIVKNAPLPDIKLSASAVLEACADFANEKSALSELVESRGHILLTSVKCHPEMAGAGVEYCWGFLKYTHRQNNDKQEAKAKGGAVFKDKIEALCKNADVLPMTRI